MAEPSYCDRCGADMIRDKARMFLSKQGRCRCGSKQWFDVDFCEECNLLRRILPDYLDIHSRRKENP